MSNISFTLVGQQDDRIFIVDDSAAPNRNIYLMSLTNAAEAVCWQCHSDYGNKRIIYRDTDMRWDEMVHDRGLFVEFRPYDGVIPFVPDQQPIKPVMPSFDEFKDQAVGQIVKFRPKSTR